LEVKNIILLGTAYPLRGGGIATFNERLVRAFVEEKHQTKIYTFSLQYPSFLFPGTSQYSTEPAPIDLDIKVCVNSINPLNWIKIGLELKKLKPDIIVVRYWLPFMGPCLGTILRIVRRNNHTKIICIADNVIPHEKRFLDKQFTQYFVKPIHAFVTMSEKVLSDLKLFTSKPCELVTHPIYDTFGDEISKQKAAEFLTLDAQTNYLLFFGFIRKYKGLDVLLDAISILKTKAFLKEKNIKLLIAGEFYEDENIYKQQIENLNIQDEVILENNFITDSEVNNYFSLCDVVVQPYKNATQSGITPLAYHFNKPSIVTNVGGLAGFIVDNKTGLIANPSPASIADKIIEFYNSNQTSYKENIAVEKKKYSWKTIVDKIITLSK
jgi:glycosyltransferase involved in cell wall biosynthesis